MERYKHSFSAPQNPLNSSRRHDVAVQALSQLLEARSPANIPEDTGNPIMHSDIEETKNLPSSSIKRSSGRDSLVSRKRTRQGKYLSDISIDDILDNIHLTGKEASKNLGLGLTSFKRVCRFYGIQSWPQNNHLVSKHKHEAKTESKRVMEVQFKSALAMMQEDIESVESANLSIDGEEREEMCTRIREFYSLSCRMRVQNNFSIFNDSVLLLLLQQLRS